MPGTGVIYTVSTGLFQGRRESLAAAVGCTAGSVPHLAASILGLSVILHMSALAFQVIKSAGAAYLLYLAWAMWRETGALNFRSPSINRGVLQIAAKGFFINILNPKLSVFFFAFLPLFISPGASSPELQLLFLGGMFMVITLGIFIIYGLVANAVGKHVVSSPGVTAGLQRSFAAVFAALGIKLAVMDR